MKKSIKNKFDNREILNWHFGVAELKDLFSSYTFNYIYTLIYKRLRTNH